MERVPCLTLIRSRPISSKVEMKFVVADSKDPKNTKVMTGGTDTLKKLPK